MSQQYFIKLSDNSQYSYCLTDSLRAKRLSLKLSSAGELRVILPQGMKVSLAHDFAQQQSAWVEKHTVNCIEKPNINTRPKHLNLKMLNELWTVKYKESTKSGIEYSEQPDCFLVLAGEVQSDKLINKIIGLFLKNKASVLFFNLMNEIALQYGFHYSGMTIRGQKTRWGSCSTRKKLNINYKLLLMPEQVTRYVFIHELCHTIEMNHSAKFWELVEQCDPKYRQHEQYLKEHGHIIQSF